MSTEAAEQEVQRARVAEIYGSAFRSGWEPEPRGTVSEWADKYRRLDPRASAEPGPWRTSRVPYMREIMDCLSTRSPIQEVRFMKGAQIGATECGNNWLGYTIHYAPGPTLVVYPTLGLAQRHSKIRFQPMIDATPALATRVANKRDRDGGNTTLAKEYPGGEIILVGAESASALRQIAIRYIMFDEIDGYPGDVEGEGDPISLAQKRTATFARKKIFKISTPTIKGLSAIETAYAGTDQRRYFIPCPLCDHFDFLTWEGRDWLGSAEGNHHRISYAEGDPGDAHMVCSGCNGRVDEHHKTAMLARGRWIATAEAADPKVAGFHLSALYSPVGWYSWSDAAQELEDARGDTFKLKTWVNTILGETWEERGSSVEPHQLLKRAEEYGDGVEVPHGAGVLVASVDVQDDRLECKVKAYGAGEESWLVALNTFTGDPSEDPLWFELDQFLKRRFRHASGRMMPIECVAIDSGGHQTEQVYKFCKVRQHRRIFAIKGGNTMGDPLVRRPTDKNRYRCKLYVLCVDTGKETVLGRLRVQSPGPGYMHLPKTIVDLEYVEQLTAEKAIRKYVPRKGSIKTWVKTRERNEALDLEVYALAALYIPGPDFVRDLARRAGLWSRPATDPGPEGAPEGLPENARENPAQPLTRQQLTANPFRRSWTRGWRR